MGGNLDRANWDTFRTRANLNQPYTINVGRETIEVIGVQDFMINLLTQRKVTKFMDGKGGDCGYCSPFLMKVVPLPIRGLVPSASVMVDIGAADMIIFNCLWSTESNFKLW